VKVLAAVGGEDATRLLRQVRATGKDPLLRLEAIEALRAVRDREGTAAPAKAGGMMGVLRRLAGAAAGERDPSEELEATRAAVVAALTRLRDAPLQDDRLRAIEELRRAGDRHALPALRVAAAGDGARAVRHAAIRALGALGDLESVDGLVRLVSSRGRDDDTAKAAADALGELGDFRGIAPLVAAFVEGWKPTTVADALLAIGAPALGPLVGSLEERPDLVARKVSLEALKRLPPTDLAAALVERLGTLRPRLAARREEASWPKAAGVYLKLAAVHREAEEAVARALLTDLAEPATKEEKALRRAAEKALKDAADGQ
jgi:hypothetical protein